MLNRLKSVGGGRHAACKYRWVISIPNHYGTDEEIEMGKSKEFNRDGEPEVKKVVTRTGPLGLVPIMYLIVSLLIILAFVFWWRG